MTKIIRCLHHSAYVTLDRLTVHTTHSREPGGYEFTFASEEEANAAFDSLRDYSTWGPGAFEVGGRPRPLKVEAVE